MASAETQNASELEHVRWIGGGSGGGKTTLSRMLAERFVCRLYSSDKAIREHGARLDPAQAPLLDAFLRSGADECRTTREGIRVTPGLDRHLGIRSLDAANCGGSASRRHGDRAGKGPTHGTPALQA